jgi:hypothetical protein
MIVDPMVVSNAAAMGVIEFSNGPILWWMTVSLLTTVSAAIALSGLHLERVARFKLPKLAHAQLVAASASRAK